MESHVPLKEGSRRNYTHREEGDVTEVKRDFTLEVKEGLTRQNYLEPF